MHITMRVVNLVDRLHLNELFVERGNRVTFNIPTFDPRSIERFITNLVKVEGKQYQKSELEVQVLKEMEF